ncbi:MAG: hypothetical protein Q4B42_02125, partial [Oscillospiraceae bacterium]|nr:hypothetical protein [Oscillospiraceae bacterium]
MPVISAKGRTTIVRPFLLTFNLAARGAPKAKSPKRERALKSRVYKREAEANVAFCVEEEQGSGRMFFFAKEKRSKADFAPT